MDSLVIERTDLPDGVRMICEEVDGTLRVYVRPDALELARAVVEFHEHAHRPNDGD